MKRKHVFCLSSCKKSAGSLTLTWVAFLRVGFEVGGGKGWLNLPSPTACLLKLVKIMLET